MKPDKPTQSYKSYIKVKGSYIDGEIITNDESHHFLYTITLVYKSTAYGFKESSYHLLIDCIKWMEEEDAQLLHKDYTKKLDDL